MCHHLRQRFGADNVWRCRSCGEIVVHERKPLDANALPQVYVKGDPDHVKEGKRYRDPRHGNRSGFEIERDLHAHVERLRGMRKEGKLKRAGTARFRGSLPNELFYARRKEDPHYWDDKKNLERHKDWLVE